MGARCKASKSKEILLAAVMSSTKMFPTAPTTAIRRVAAAAVLPPEALRVVRKSLDARRRRGRGGPAFSYVVDVDVAALGHGAAWGLASVAMASSAPAAVFPASPAAAATATQTALAAVATGLPPLDWKARPLERRDDPVVVVGAGPAGLFAALRLAEQGRPVTILERGQVGRHAALPL